MSDNDELRIEDLVDFGELDMIEIQRQSLEMHQSVYRTDLILQAMIAEVARLEGREASLRQDVAALSPEEREPIQGASYEDHLIDLMIEIQSEGSQVLDVYFIRLQALMQRFNRVANPLRKKMTGAERLERSKIGSPNKFDVCWELGNYGRHRHEWGRLNSTIDKARQYRGGSTSRLSPDAQTIVMLMSVLPGLYASAADPDPSFGPPIEATEIHDKVLAAWFPESVLSSRMRQMAGEMESLESAEMRLLLEQSRK